MYQKGDKFQVIIEGEERFFRYSHDVVDFVSDKTHFEVDEYALTVDLKYLDKHDVIELREDCVIKRIA
jgi:hypothetical protein